jgi:ribosomal protein S18 acetylase RimI-like enzyme
MSADPAKIWLSGIDEERFGFRTARASSVTAEALDSVIEFCRSKDVQFLIARCASADLSAAQAMERNGFELMDTLVYYVRDLTRTPIPPDANEVVVRPVCDGEEKAVRAIAESSFRGYFGHYHADSRLDRVKCDETYVSWASRTCSARGPTSEVLVAESDGSLVGFATLRLNTPEEGEVVLNGVSPPAQRQGIYRSLVLKGMEWCQSRRAQRMLISTQLTNLAAQRVWTRLGFELKSAQYTFHKWFR